MKTVFSQIVSLIKSKTILKITKLIFISFLYFVAIFICLECSHRIIELFRSSTFEPPRPIPLSLDMRLKNITFDGSDYIVDTFLTVNAPEILARELNLTMIYYNRVGEECQLNITFEKNSSTYDKSLGLKLKTFGDPSNFPFDRYYTDMLFKFVNSSETIWPTLSGKGLIDKRLTSEWFIFLFFEGSRLTLYLVRNPWNVLLEYCLPFVLLSLSPVVLVIKKDDLNSRLIGMFTIVFSSLAIAKTAPVPFFSSLDFIKGILLLDVILLILYIIFSTNLKEEPLRKINWLVTISFSPFPLFLILHLLQVLFVQIPLSPDGIGQWLFAFKLSSVLTLLILSLIIMAIKTKCQWIISKYGWFIFTFIGAVAIMVPLSFLFYLEAMSPISISTLLVYLFAIFFIHASLKWWREKSQIVTGFLFIFIGGVIYFLTFLLGEILPTSYSPNITLYQPERPPGWYIILRISALAPLEILYVYLVFTLIIFIIALPAAIVGFLVYKLKIL